MVFLILAAILTLLVYLPSLWVRHVMRRYSRELPDLPGTGGELAEHLIQRFALDGIRVEQTDPLRDHFDPSGPAVRLSPANYNGRSLTAVAVATHEVGHAMQFHRNERIFQLRKRYLPTAHALGQAGIAVMLAIPLFAVVLRVPWMFGLLIGLSLLLQLAGALTYLIVLPEEWDASFNKALPILIEGEYVSRKQLPAVRKVLRAAALTYFASALANMLNIGRWFLLLRR
ncbi:MAG: zinc metallopeptidase [Pseudohongiellaceae bacterium]